MIKKLLRKIPLAYQFRRDFRRAFGLMGITHNTNIPDPLFTDDLFLVSYPKSGNTWLRFMLVHLQSYGKFMRQGKAQNWCQEFTNWRKVFSNVITINHWFALGMKRTVVGNPGTHCAKVIDVREK
jgi:hypothetical protein